MLRNSAAGLTLGESKFRPVVLAHLNDRIEIIAFEKEQRVIYRGAGRKQSSDYPRIIVPARERRPCRRRSAKDQRGLG